jgi:hypothetical protein
MQSPTRAPIAPCASAGAAAAAPLTVERAERMLGAFWALVPAEALLSWRRAIGNAGGGDAAAEHLPSSARDYFTFARQSLVDDEGLQPDEAASEAFVLAMIDDATRKDGDAQQPAA